mmetsp:Transcript_31402/g.73293  ORF Transcript_31402/g.73293 Transcript_31402/m.73293 type:complete len:219 (+) Transcript_31402:1487-2143(+)
MASIGPCPISAGPKTLTRCGRAELCGSAIHEAGFSNRHFSDSLPNAHRHPLHRMEDDNGAHHQHSPGILPDSRRDRCPTRAYNLDSCRRTSECLSGSSLSLRPLGRRNWWSSTRCPHFLFARIRQEGTLLRIWSGAACGFPLCSNDIHRCSRPLGGALLHALPRKLQGDWNPWVHLWWMVEEVDLGCEHPAGHGFARRAHCHDLRVGSCCARSFLIVA